MQDPLTVAINAQISIDYPGGSETNVVSLMKAIGETHRDEKFLFVNKRKNSQGLLSYTGLNQKFIDWPFSQVGYPVPLTFRRPLGVRAKKFRDMTGPFGPGVTLAYWIYRGSRDLYQRLSHPPQQNPTAREVDPILRAQGVSIVHFPYAQYFETTLPFIYEPWDLQHCHYPEFFSKKEWAWRDRLYRDGCQRAHLIVTATQWVKQDLVAQYSITPNKIAVIPRNSLLTHTALPQAKEAAAWQRYSIPKIFVFYPAMTFPHKNHIRLLQALAQLRNESGIILPLVCSGRIYEPHWPKIHAEIERLQLQSQIKFLGVVSAELLSSLFKNAQFVIYPSLFEGLGLPILEAMQYGTPILASNATCIPEVVGDAARLFDGHRVEAICEALTEAVTNPDLLKQVSSRGAKQLQRFSWEKAVKTFIACYRSSAGWSLSDEQQCLLAEATGT